MRLTLSPNERFRRHYSSSSGGGHLEYRPHLWGEYLVYVMYISLINDKRMEPMCPLARPMAKNHRQ